MMFYTVLLILVYVRLMKVRLITAAWKVLTHMGLVVLPGMERQNSVIPFPSFFSHWILHSSFKRAGGGFLSWGWSNKDQVAQQGSIISILGDPQNLTGHDPEQPALFGPSLIRELEYLTSRSASLLPVVRDFMVSLLDWWGVEWSHQNNF